MENSDVIKMEIDEPDHDWSIEGGKTPDNTFYRNVVLEIIVQGLHFAREVCDLRFGLFLQAAYYHLKHNDPHLLQPFPFCFYDKATKTNRYDELWLCLSGLPTIGEINESTTLPELSWELLHWIFTNELNIEFIKGGFPFAPVDPYTEELRNETKLMTIPRPSNSCSRFEINYFVESNSTGVFMCYREDFGSFFAYHGSQIHDFHSIIYRGLRCSLNVRSVYGPGTYLSSDLHTAESYSKLKENSKLYAYPSSTAVRCIAIVEVIKHPSITVVNFDATTPVAPVTPAMKFNDTSSNKRRYYVVPFDDLMRLKYLIVFH